MANEKPIPPDLYCPVPAQANPGYYSSDQSYLNVSRQDSFKLVITVPDILQKALKQQNRECHGGSLEKLQMSIWGFVVPELTITTIKQGYNGQVMKFSGFARPEFPPVHVNFTVDNNFDNYYILYKWLDIQNDDSNSQFDGKNMSNFAQGSVNDYSTIFTVYAIDEYKKEIAKWDYFGAFPTVLGGVNASHRETKELESSFTFEYSQIKMNLM